MIVSDLANLSVYDLLADKSRWCVGRRAQNAKGRTVQPHSEDAVAWCMIGALQFIYIDLCSYQNAYLRVEEVCMKKYECSIAMANDCLQHYQILDILKEAQV